MNYSLIRSFFSAKLIGGRWLPSVLIACLCGLAQPGIAQSTAMNQARQWYDRETIYLLSPNRYVRNNTVYTGHPALRQEFSISPGGMQLYVRSRRTRNFALVFSLVGSAGTIYTLATGNRNNYRTFFWVSLGTGLGASLLNARASTQLNQAVWLRNRDALNLMEAK
jgi:hypothetical protein